MTETVNSLMRRYGQQARVLRDGECLPVRAFFQPLTSRREEERQYVPSPLGLRREDRFLYLGQPQVELKAGEDRVEWMGRCYDIQSAHPIYIGQRLSHWWAVLRPGDKEET